MLKLAGETDVGLEKIEVINYSPRVQDTGDLEAGTHTIVPTARPAIASAQYSASLTLTKPSDARLAVKRIAARLSVNIAGLGTATTVNCAVRVDVDDVDHELFNESWASTGAKLAVVEAHSGNKATLFNLLKDGASHTFYFLFWADVASQATIDVVQLWEGVGSANTVRQLIWQIEHTGQARFIVNHQRVGTGSVDGRIGYSLEYNAGPQGRRVLIASESLFDFLIGSDPLEIWLKGSVATDLNYLSECYLILRSEQ